MDAFDAAVEEVVDVNSTDRPVLVGTRDVAESERLADALRERGIEVMVRRTPFAAEGSLEWL